MFNGDLDLSVIMTFVSTIGSLGYSNSFYFSVNNTFKNVFCLVFMPLYLYTIGRVYTNATNITIPFLRLLANLFTTIGPCLFGLVLVRFFPKLKPFFVKIAKPVTTIALLSFLLFILVAKYYAFFLVNWKQWLCKYNYYF